MKSAILFFSLISTPQFHISADEVFPRLGDLDENLRQFENDRYQVDRSQQKRMLVAGIVGRSYLERNDASFENDRQSDSAKRSESNLPCNPNDDQYEMLRLVNKARAVARDCGSKAFKAAPSLNWNCKLKDAAYVHSQDMIDYDYFDHEGSDGSSVGMRVSRSGYDWRAVGENVAAGYPDNEQVMANLLSSPTHCENIMDPKFREFGFAVIATDQARYYNYWTQVFALK